jgi:hypothetical protein
MEAQQGRGEVGAVVELVEVVVVESCLDKVAD